MSKCLFCDIANGSIPSEAVFESDRTYGFRDINPQAPVHVLVIPRRHIVDANSLRREDGDDLADMFVSARKIAEAEGIASLDRGFRLVFNVGPDATNSVGHLHLHVIGGRQMTWPPG